MSDRCVRTTNLSGTRMILKNREFKPHEEGISRVEGPICPACFAPFTVLLGDVFEFLPCPSCGAEVFIEVREVTSVVWWSSLDGPSVETV